MKQVKFIYNTASHGGEHIYTVEKNIDEKESLRNVTNDIVKEAANKGFDFPRFKEGIETDSLVQITTDANEIGKGVSDRVYLMENGEVHFLTFYESMSREWTLEEFEDLNSKGFLSGNISTVYIAYPSGLGGGFNPNFVNLVTDAIINIILEEGIRGGAKLAIKTAKELFSRNEIKKVVEKWDKFNGISEARQIRAFIEKKESWRTQELANRLGTSERFTMALLNSVGYELSDNSWFKSYSTDAEIRRNNWKEKVEKY